LNFAVCLESAGCVGVKERPEFHSLQRPDPERCLRLFTPRSIRAWRAESGHPRRMTLSADARREPLHSQREVA
jgi:hypothetical protein